MASPNCVPRLTHLLQSMSCLQVGVVACPDGPHGGGLIASVALSGVFKVRIRTTRTVHTDVARHVDVRTTVGLAHHCHHCYLEQAKFITLIITSQQSLGKQEDKPSSVNKIDLNSTIQEYKECII